MKKSGHNQNTPDVFWTRVRKGGGCWEWAGHVNSHGYGMFCVKGKSLTAHRLSYIYTYGAIPEGLSVLHHCDNPLCVRPDHLWLGTQLDNLADMKAKGRGRTPRGAESPRAKLTWDQVSEIRTRYRNGGVTQKQLGREYGVNPSVISLIIHDKQWKEEWRKE
jgi:hypothetical protein